MGFTTDFVPDLEASPVSGPAEAGYPHLNPIAMTEVQRLAARSTTRLSPAIVSGVSRGLEFVLLAATGGLTYYFYLGSLLPEMALAYVAVSVTTAIVASLLFEAMRLYTIPALRAFPGRTIRLAGGWMGLIGLLIVLGFLTKLGIEFSRIWLVIWFVTGLASLIVMRAGASVFVKNATRSGRLMRRAVIVGGGGEASDLIAAINASNNSGIEICGLFDDRQSDRSPSQVRGYTKFGTIAELTSFTRSADIDLLIVSLPYTAETRLLEVMRQLWVLPVDVRLAANTSKLRYRPRTYSYIGDVPCLDVLDKPLKDWGPVLKALEDRLIASLALIVALPVMALVATAVKLETRGPVLFRQHRYGFNNELIEVYKFRSMFTEDTDANGIKLVTKNDPRVTGVGRFIRKTSLDELPQLFNVLRGDLSLVGPRPHATSAKATDQLYGDVVDGYFARHRMKPGITGWAQVNGWRGETDTSDKIIHRVEHDLYYIENWSVLFDLYILAITPLSLLNTEQAY